MSLLRYCGIFTIVLGVAILAGEVYIVGTRPESEWPTRNPRALLVVPIAFILVGLKWCFAPSRPESEAERQAREHADAQPTEFEKYISYGISRATFYGVGCLILGLGMLIPIAAIFLKANTPRETNGSLICAGIGPFPLIACGIYLLARPKRPGPRPPLLSENTD
jgi:hypothetical protein